MVPKKKRGPAPTGKGIQIQVRIQPDKLAQLDRWIADQKDQLSRPEAIRRIVERTLAHFSRPKRISKKRAQAASDRASRAAERLVDKSIPPEEQQRRKRALIKGRRNFAIFGAIFQSQRRSSQ
jgi:hypothetical protein